MKRHFVSLLLLFFVSTQLFAVEEHVIKSTILGYSLKYWIHVPENTTGPLPVLYVTDGNGYLGNGLVDVSKGLIKEGKINPHIIVMVSAIDPNNRSINRRNSQFLCNPKYVRFYKEELIPEIDRNNPTINGAEGRGILGLSFGGLNAMYFAIQANDTFKNIGIQSPAPHPCPSIYDDFQSSPRLPLNIFLSTG
ncbi:MAG: alpha/beta hydrolase-fold protein, partial [Cyclobacteriaceae bacterium]